MSAALSCGRTHEAALDACIKHQTALRFVGTKWLDVLLEDVASFVGLLAFDIEADESTQNVQLCWLHELQEGVGNRIVIALCTEAQHSDGQVSRELACLTVKHLLHNRLHTPWTAFEALDEQAVC